MDDTELLTPIDNNESENSRLETCIAILCFPCFCILGLFKNPQMIWQQ